MKKSLTLTKSFFVAVTVLATGVFASPVLADSVTFRGDITSSVATTAGYYFSYSIGGGSTSVTPTRSTAVNGTQIVSETVDIPCNSTYQYQLVFWDSSTPQNIFYANTQSASTLSCSQQNQNQSSPTITTNAPTNVSSNSATFQGSVNSNGGVMTNVWFEWGTSNSFGNTTPQVNVGTVNTTFYSVNNSLNQNTTYYYRAVGQNSGSAVVYGGTQSFTTNNYNYNCGYNNYNCNQNTGQTPFVMTYSTVQNGDTFAILQGFVDPNGSTNTTRWFEWGTNSSYFNNTTLKLNQTSSGTFTQTVNGLSPNTTYYYRAVAQNSNGSVYGTVMSFVTNSNNLYNSSYNYVGGSQPTAVTTLATAIGQTTARLNGLAFINGGVYTSGWFEWGTTSSLGNTTSTKGIGSAPTLAFSESLSGLTSGTTYYYRAVAQNQYGTHKGDIMSFVVNGSSNTATSVVITEPTVTTSKTTYVATGVSGSTKTSAIILSISSDRDNVSRGDRVIFTVNYRNTKTSESLHDVAVRVVLPGELSYVDSSRGYYNTKDRTLTVDLKTLEPGEAGSFTVETRVDNAIESGKVVVVSVDMVYTRANNTQEEAIAYVLLNGDYYQSSGAMAPIFGSSFLPNTLLGWLLLILIILGLGILSRYAVDTYRANNVTKK